MIRMTWRSSQKHTQTRRFQQTLAVPRRSISRVQSGDAGPMPPPGEADPKAKSQPSRRPSRQRSRAVMEGCVHPSGSRKAPHGEDVQRSGGLLKLFPNQAVCDDPPFVRGHDRNPFPDLNRSAWLRFQTRPGFCMKNSSRQILLELREHQSDRFRVTAELIG